MTNKTTWQQALRDWMVVNNIRDKSFVEAEVEKHMAPPDFAKLRKKEVNEVTNRIIASCRAQSGARNAFPFKRNGKTEIVYVPGTNDLDATVRIEERLLKNTIGINKTLGPVSLWKAELVGQLTLDFSEEEKSKV